MGSLWAVFNSLPTAIRVALVLMLAGGAQVLASQIVGPVMSTATKTIKRPLGG